MNAFGYIVRRILWQFGIKRSKKRWEIANRELQYLKAAEDLLGKLAWREADQVEELTGEYWQLKHIENHEKALQEEGEKLKAETERLEDKIFEVTDELHEQIDSLTEQRASVASQVDKILIEIEEVREDAAAIRHRFDGMKVKYKVMKDEGRSEADLEVIQEGLRKLRDEFNARKEATVGRNKKIEEIEQGLAKFDDEIHAKRKLVGERTAVLSQKIGENSKRQADVLAKLGAYERERQELQSKMGLYLSANPHLSPGHRRATARHMRLIQQINYFRKSIQYNQRLARGA